MELAEIPDTLPLLPVRDLVVFPFMVVPLTVTRRLSASALEEAMAGSRLVMVVAQKDAAAEQPAPSGLYNIGTVCTIMRMGEEGNGCQLLLQGLVKAQVSNFFLKDEHYLAEITPLAETTECVDSSAEQEALLRNVRAGMTNLAQYLGAESQSALMVVNAMTAAGQMADLVASHLGLTVAQAQELLETNDGWTRLAKVNSLLSRELAVLAVQEELKSQANADLKQSQRHYILEQQLERIKAELGETDSDEYDELQDKIDNMLLPDEVRQAAAKELKILRKAGQHSAESSVIYNYINTLLDFPWYVNSSDNLDISHARKVLEDHHAYLAAAKERILEYLAVCKLQTRRRGAIICLVGPPGVGKTSLGYSIGAALGRKVVRVALGGVCDEAEIRGHRRTYVGAMPGRIIQAIMQAGTANPLLILDEIDKLVAGNNGNPAAALLEVLDPEQNNSFRDHYLGVAVDLSQVFFVATANQLENLPPALRDRLEVIQLSGYSTAEKVTIAQRFIVPSVLSECGLTENNLRLGQTLLERIILDYTREAGCRSLHRRVETIGRKQALKLAENSKIHCQLTAKDLLKIFGPPRYRYEEDNGRSRVGVVNALAWTPVGGEILHIESTAMPGHGGLTITGQLGEVMRESAQIALSFVRANVAVLNIAADFFDTHDVHIHVPAAAMPKDGPSAGMAMALCLASMASDRPVSGGLAVTGEISLRGQLLAIGGLKEKLLAAQRYNIRRVFYPAENYCDICQLDLPGRPQLELVEMDDLLTAVKAGLE